jgi:outer membrane protein
MRYSNFFLLLLVLSLTVSTVEAQDATGAADPSTAIGTTLTVKQAVDIAIKNNLLVVQADITAQTNKVNYDQAWGNMLPQVSGTASEQIGFGRTLNTYNYQYVNQVQTGNYGINANLTLFSGLQLQNNLKGNRYAYNASKLDLQQQKDNITLNVLLAYLQVLSSRDLLNIAIEQADIDKKQVDRLDAQNKEGALLLLSNLSDLQGQYAGDQVNIATAANTLESAKVNLFSLLNVPYKRDVEYENSIANISIADYQQPSDSIYRTALDIIPGIKSADLKTKAYLKFLQAARGQYYPTLSAYGGITTNYYSLAYNQIPTNVSVGSKTPYYINGPTGQEAVIQDIQNYSNQKISWGNQFSDNKASSVGVQLNVPILNYMRARNNVKQAKINLKNAEVNNNNTKLALQQNVELAFQNMIAAYKQYKFYMEQVAAYAESFRTTEIRFNEGVVNSDVYVIAKNNIDRANTNLAAAKYTYIFRTKVLDYYQGKLSW